jgi:hypothetical protein
LRPDIAPEAATPQEPEASPAQPAHMCRGLGRLG